MASRLWLINLLITIFFFGIAIMAKAENLPTTDKSQILASTFTIITKSNELPGAVKSYINQTTKTKKYFADPEEPFELGCNEGSGLPRCRLIYAAINKKYCLLYYEAGGAAYKHILEILAINQSVAREIYFTRLAPVGYPKKIQFKTIKQLKDIIRSPN